MTRQDRRSLTNTLTARHYYIRNPVVEVILPAASEQETEYLSFDFLGDATDRIKPLSGLELLFYHHVEQRLLITPKVSTEQMSGQTKLTDKTGDESVGTTQWRVAKKVGRLLLDKLPTNYGVALGHADLSPLGKTPVWTTRILLRENHDLVDKSVLTWSPVVATIRELVRHNTPYLIQTLLTDRNLVSVRIAVIGQHKPATTDEFFEWLYEHNEAVVTPHWRQAGFETSLDLPIKDYWDKDIRRLRPQVPNYSRPSHAWDMRRAYTGTTEYGELLRSRQAPLPAYKYPKHAYYGKISASIENLELFAALRPDNRSVDWSKALGRKQPNVEWTVVPRKPAGRDKVPRRKFPGHSDVESIEPETLNVQTDGDDGHGVGWVIDMLSEYRYHVWEVEQTTQSVPDGGVAIGETPPKKLDSLGSKRRIYTLEHESKTLSKPTRVLQNKERAAYAGMPTVVVVNGDGDTTEDKQAKHVAGILTAPYREQIEGVGVRTYNIDDDIEIEDGAVVLLPRDVSETRWHLTTDGQLRLICNGECVAAGPADADISEFNYDLPRLSTVNGDKYIVGPDGNVIERGYSATDWTKASPPHVPYHHHYLHGTHLLHSAGNPLSEVPLPLSDATQLTENKSDILQWLLKTYLDVALVKKEGAEIYRSQIEAEFRSLLDQLSVPLLDETDWQTVEEINDTWFGRCFPDNEDSAADLNESAKKFHRGYSLYENDNQANESTGPAEVDVIETEEGWVNGEKVRRIQDYAFVFPTGIVSPHTSHVDIDRESILGDVPSDIS